MILAKDQEERWQSNFKDAINHRHEVIEKLRVERSRELLEEPSLLKLSVLGQCYEYAIPSL